MPLQPAVLAYNSANDSNVSGNGTVATVDFNTEIFDQNADFASDTFTAPVTGRYLVVVNVFVTGIAAPSQMTTVLVTSNRSYRIQEVDDIGMAFIGFEGSVIVDMDASDTFTVTYQGSGESGGDIHDIKGASSNATRISAVLIA
jgi:hypothetical protein